MQRYDGNKFVTISSRNDNAKLPSLPVDLLVYDSLRNVIWISLGNGQIVGRFIIEDGDFVPAKLSVNVFPNGLINVDKKGNVILTVFSMVAFVFNDRTNSFEKNPDVIDVPPHFSLLNIYEYRKQNWFYLCGKEGLRIYDPSNKTFYSADNNPYHITALNAARSLNYVQFVLIDSKERFWIKAWPSGQSYMSLYLLNKESNTLENKDVDPNQKGYHDLVNLTETIKYYGAMGIMF